MIISLALTLLVTASGTLATYLYDEGASFASRLCAGVCTGVAALGLIGFVCASFLGLTPLAIALTMAVILAVALLALMDPSRRAAVQNDLEKASQTTRRSLLHPGRVSLVYPVFYVIVAAILWQVFSRAVIELPEGLYTGDLNNFGDLPFHLSVITGFAYGKNFPPEDPTFAGVRFTYPFLTDFVSAIFVRCGSNLRDSMFIENFVLAFSFVGLLHRWAVDLVRDRLAAVITPLLVFLNGGLGWVLLWQQATQNEKGLLGTLQNLPASFTVIPETTWRWGNAVSALLIPQRGILLGLPLAVIVFTQWWAATGNEEPAAAADGTKSNTPPAGRGATGKTIRKQKSVPMRDLKARTEANDQRVYTFELIRVSSVRRMIAAGIAAGLLPLVHAHSFVVVMAMGGCIALLQRRWRDWAIFFIVASLIAVPQMWWSTHQSAVDSSKFFEVQLGWDRGNENAVWFWLKNTGMFIPLIVAAIVWHDKDYLVPRRLLRFYLPFTLCFIVPNLVRMAPWVWDNIKVLFYWWLASAPLVALLLARLWQQGKGRRVLAVVLFVCLTLAGSLDVAAIALRSTKYQVFDRHGMEFAELVKGQTQPRSLIIHAPVHNHPVFLTGRRSLMGYPGHIWTHGLDFVQRESEIKRIYAGAPDAARLIAAYGIEYAVVSPLERGLMNVNDRFFSQYQKVGEVGEYSLYKIAAP